MHRILGYLGLLSILLFQKAAEGQVVNIENLRLSGKESGWSGSNLLNFSFTQNTRQVWQIGNRLRVGYLEGKHSVLFMSDINFVKADTNSFVNDGFEHIRYGYQLADSGRITLEGYKQLQYNKVQKIRLRSLYAGGIRVHAIDRDSAQLSLGFSPMLEFEDVTDGSYNRHFRLSMYFALDLQFSKHFGFNTITSYQPDAANWIDYRLSHETSVRANITNQLGVQVIFNLNYDEYPPEGVPQAFFSFRNAISFRF